MKPKTPWIIRKMYDDADSDVEVVDAAGNVVMQGEHGDEVLPHYADRDCTCGVRGAIEALRLADATDSPQSPASEF